MKLRLTDLEPQFVRHERKIRTARFCSVDHVHTTDCGELRTGPADYIVDVSTVGEAQGVSFLDPVEFVKNSGPVGTSMVVCWFKGRGVPDDVVPGPGRWDVSGSTFEDLTLNPSVDLTMGGKHPGWWHGWVQNGEVT
jgi:hypothetical protein